MLLLPLLFLFLGLSWLEGSLAFFLHRSSPNTKTYYQSTLRAPVSSPLGTTIHHDKVSLRQPRRHGLVATAHEISQNNNPGGYFIEEKLEVFVGGKVVKFETGKVGRSADGSVMVSQGETVVYATACFTEQEQEVDFAPLRVDYFERFSAAGMTSGSYNKRDGKAADHEILVSRLIDRPLRPSLVDGWTCETQVLNWVVSYDGVNSPDALAICASSAALCLSRVPLTRPVGGVIVGMIDGEFVINPTVEEEKRSSLHLAIAGTEEGILMIEGGADFLPEETIIAALKVGHDAIKVICRALSDWSQRVGKPKKTDLVRTLPSEVTDLLRDHYTQSVDAALRSDGGRNAEHPGLRHIEEDLLAKHGTGGEGQHSPLDLKIAFKKLVKTRMALMVAHEQRRADGRKPTEVRPISVELGLLPKPHGSCLFTRGETQALVTVTLGNRGMAQRIDSIDGSDFKRFYLQYFFPPSSVGEVGRVGAPGRREVGHGNLAERAIIPSLPNESEFPYTIRVESLITESCGSSSMASACGGSLALMDAGVPVSTHIAGVAMGLLLDDALEEPVILTDILGLEDAFGTMDFKVCGDDKGITSFQLDIKCDGLTFPVLEKALAQAKEGRLHILSVMKAAEAGPRPEPKNHVPKLDTMKIPPTMVGKLIGPSGRQIKSIIEDFKLQSMDINEEGMLEICSTSSQDIQAARKFIQEFLKDEMKVSQQVEYRGPMPEVGTVFREVTVKGVHPFGVFVEILPGLDGLVHVSELAPKRVVNVESFLKSGDKIDVKLIGINEKGQLRLSRKVLLMDEDGGKGGKEGKGGGDKPKKPKEKEPKAASTP